MMRLVRFGLLGAAILVGGLATDAVVAADDPIAVRQALMKSVGGSAKVLARMLEGKQPYDAAKAVEALTAMQKAGTDFYEMFDTLYPAASKDGDTTASAAVWEKSDEFKAKSKMFAKDAAAAIEATKVDEAAFKGAAGKVLGTCKGCHETFRKPS